MRAAVLAACLCAAPVTAQEVMREVTRADYADLLAQPHRLITFDDLSILMEPGHVLDGPVRYPGAVLGERLYGQTLAASGPFDVLEGTALEPRALPGAPGRNLAVAWHPGLGSNALFPLGPDGPNTLSGRGEGALAIRFTHAQTAFGLRLHAGYPDPLGTRPPTGEITVTFYGADGAPIGTDTLRPPRGPQALAWRFAVPAAAVTVTNADPGGIALDDIVTLPPRPTG